MPILLEVALLLAVLFFSLISVISFILGVHIFRANKNKYLKLGRKAINKQKIYDDEIDDLIDV